ncbi:MAG: hypothetical protein AB8B80_07160 [Marinicellaceae bacterium]
MNFDKVKDDFLFYWNNGKDRGTGFFARNGNTLSGYFLVAGQSNKIPWELKSTTATNCGIPDFSAQKCNTIREKFDKKKQTKIIGV